VNKLIFILTIAAILRFWNLWIVPPSASLDEASIGYNAYSVLKTGGDEYGEFPIISQRGYDDWRRSTYLFLTLPFITFFDLNAVSVRLPAVILSVLTVLATYFLVLQLFRIKKWEAGNGRIDNETGSEKKSLTSHFKNLDSHLSLHTSSIALLTSFLLAISPWHIYISRLGHESNACLSFLVFGVLFFLQGNKDKSMGKIFLSLIFFTLSMISYYSGQALIPLFVVGLFFLFRKNILSIVLSDRKILIPFFIFFILLIPVFIAIFSPEALVRFQGTSTFKPEAHSEMFAKRVELRNKAVESNDIVSTILYNRHFFPIQVFIEGYLSHFKIEWLFTNLSKEPHKVPNLGLLYIWQAPFILLGIILFASSRIIDIRAKQLIFLWFFLGPLPASLATQAPHAMRSYNFVLIWQIFAAYALGYAFYKLQKFKALTLFAFAIFILFSLLTFYKNYFVIFPKEQSSSFQYALSQAISFVAKHEDEYKKIVYSNENNLYQSYMFFLFYSKYDPKTYQKLGGTKSGGFAETHSFDKYEFRPIKWDNEFKDPDILYVGNNKDFPENVETIKTVDYLNGELGIKIVKGN